MVHQFAPIAREPAYLKVYKAIETDIREGRLAPGAFLPTETELAGQFDVHRSTVREGIRLLEQEGLIRRGAAKRLIVSRPQTSELAATASRGLALSGVTFLEAWQTLALVQPEAARLAAEQVDAVALDRFERSLAAFRAAPATDDEATVRAAGRFFDDIAACVENQVLAMMLQSLNLLVGPSLRRVLPAAPNARRRILRAQQEIIRAFADGDGARAADWMRKHVEDLKRGYEVAGVDLTSDVA
ncbi:MAG: FCD domain-containing protein [Pseudomonadota bacterium]